MIDARRLRLIIYIFKEVTILNFCSRDPWYTHQNSERWKYVSWKFPGPPPKPMWVS